MNPIWCHYYQRFLYIRVNVGREGREREREKCIHRYILILHGLCIFIFGQASLDGDRSRIFGIREAYRAKLLEAERLRLEAVAAEEAALRAEQEKKSPDVQKKKAGKTGGKKK